MKRLHAIASLLCLSFLVACAPGETAAPSGTATESATETASSENPPISVGQQMPDFRGKQLDGTPFQFSEMKGRPVLVNLWATWCGPCRAEIPELQELYEMHEAKGFAVLGVSVDDPSVLETIPSFLAEYNVTYPNIHDSEGQVADIFDAYAIPTSALVDRTGKVVWTKIGMIRFDDRDLRSALARAVEE